MRRSIAAVSLMSLAGFTGLVAAAPVPPSTGARTLDFSVTLDDVPIGEHRFAIDEQADRRVVTSQAAFTVKLGFLPLYRYRHHAHEVWRDGCLVSLTAETDDDGRRTTVSAAPAEGGGLQVVGGDGAASSATAPGKPLEKCVMTFAYWNPSILRQQRLLNVQTGEYDRVTVQPLGSDVVQVRGQGLRADRFRIGGLARPIDLWYAAGERWVALETTVDGGRRLRYRLR